MSVKLTRKGGQRISHLHRRPEFLFRGTNFPTAFGFGVIQSSNCCLHGVSKHGGHPEKKNSTSPLVKRKPTHGSVTSRQRVVKVFKLKKVEVELTWGNNPSTAFMSLTCVKWSVDGVCLSCS